MKRRLFLPFVAAALALAVTSSPSLASDFPEGSPKFLSSHDEAVKAAKAAGKPVVLVFSASWCPPCQSNKKKVYPSDAVKAFHDKFIWAYLDTDQESNAEAGKKFKVEGIPHIEFLSKEGKSLGNTVGGTSPERFAGKLTEVLAKAK